VAGRYTMSYRFPCTPDRPTESHVTGRNNIMSPNRAMESRTGRRLLKAASVKHFQRWAHHYDRDIINVLLFEPSYRRVLCLLRQWRRHGMRRLRILDIGCGTGTLAIRCLAMDPPIDHICGLDMAENMIAQARQKAVRSGIDSRTSFTVGDAEHLPFPKGSFDVVTCCNSFHHYPHQPRAVREMKRVLDENGRLIIIDGSRDDPVGFFIFDICVAWAEKNVHHCSRARFHRLLSRAGFQHIDQRVFGVCPPALLSVAYA